MTRDKYETARKLRRLAQSPNEHEAARARETYQAYLKQHQIREEDLRMWADRLPNHLQDVLIANEKIQQTVAAWQADLNRALKQAEESARITAEVHATVNARRRWRS